MWPAYYGDDDFWRAVTTGMTAAVFDVFDGVT